MQKLIFVLGKDTFTANAFLEEGWTIKKIKPISRNVDPFKFTDYGAYVLLEKEESKGDC